MSKDYLRLVVDRPGLGRAVTPLGSRRAPIHRWYRFAHGFSPELVGNLVPLFGLQPGAVLADPFMGAGTCVVAARGLGLTSVGIDHLPLASFVSSVKLSAVTSSELALAAREVARPRRAAASVADPVLCERAFSPETLHEVEALLGLVSSSRLSPCASSATLLALLAVVPRFSRLMRRGGWLSSTGDPQAATDLRPAVGEHLEMMEADVRSGVLPVGAAPAIAMAGDARHLALASGVVDAVITSPPYPNRHDYTRAHGLELAVGFRDIAGVLALRRQSLESHPKSLSVVFRLSR